MYPTIAFKPFPKNKFLDITKFKAFAGNKLNIAKITISLRGRDENTVEKEENAGYQHFLFFPTVFSKVFCFTVVNNQDCVVKG